MSHKDNMDLRNTGDGGWFYAEHELFSVFAPLIGADGVAVYMAMCRLIPLAAVDSRFPVTMDAIEEASTVSKTQAQRMKSKIVALGMVQETTWGSRRPSTYKLVPLRQLAMVGVAELERRIGVPPRDTEKRAGRAKRSLKQVPIAAETSSTQGDHGKARQGLDSREATPLRGSGESGIPQWDTEPESKEITLVDLLVSQKEASVSQKQASVSQNRGSLIKRIKSEESPLSPPEGGTLPKVAAMSATEAEELRYVNEFRARLKPPLPPLSHLEKSPARGTTYPDRPQRRRRRRL